MNFTPAERRAINEFAARSMFNALQVVARDEKIRAAILAIDPKAVQQIDRAITEGARLV